MTAHGNDFSAPAVGVSDVQRTDPVDATSNRWGKTGGPKTPGAATAVGPVRFDPWLTTPPG